jgi:hypothetical protein
MHGKNQVAQSGAKFSTKNNKNVRKKIDSGF